MSCYVITKNIIIWKLVIRVDNYLRVWVLILWDNSFWGIEIKEEGCWGESLIIILFWVIFRVDWDLAEGIKKYLNEDNDQIWGYYFLLDYLIHIFKNIFLFFFWKFFGCFFYSLVYDVVWWWILFVDLIYLMILLNKYCFWFCFFLKSFWKTLKFICQNILTENLWCLAKWKFWMRK